MKNIIEYKQLKLNYKYTKIYYNNLIGLNSKNKSKLNKVKRAMDNYIHKMNILYDNLSDEEKLYVELMEE